MSNSVFPNRIQKMILSGWNNGEDATTVTNRINKSATAKKHKVRYTVRQVAASMAWHTIRERYGR